MIWKTFSSLSGRNINSNPRHIELDDGCIFKPADIANYFNDYYREKILRLKTNMSIGNSISSSFIIKNEIMKDMHCAFNLTTVSVEKVESLLNALPENRSAGLDHIDGKLLKLAARFVSRPLCHTFSRCLVCGVFPTQWKMSKIIPIPKNKSVSFNGANSRPISILPVLGKIMETIICEQIQ